MKKALQAQEKLSRLANISFEVTDNMTLVEKRELINILLDELSPKASQPSLDQVPDKLQTIDPSKPDFSKKI